MKHTIAALAMIITFGVLTEAQTIADIARQARASRQGKPPAPRITTAMIRSGPASEAVAEEVRDDTAPQAAAEKPAGDGRDEKWWRNEFLRVRDEVRRAQDQVTLIDAELKKANLDFLQTSFDPTNQGRRTITETTERLDNAKKNLDMALARVANLEEDMRRSGAPPGWAR